jgi:hypothetical protein
MANSIQAINPRFVGDDVENPKSELTRVNAAAQRSAAATAPAKTANQLRGLAVIFVIMVAAGIALLLVGNDKDAEVTVAPSTLAPTSAPTSSAPTTPTTLAPSATPTSSVPTAAPTSSAPTLSPTETPDAIVTFAPDAPESALSAPYTATAAAKVFEVSSADKFVKVTFPSGNLENGFDTLEVWNSVDVGVARKLPLKVLTGANLRNEAPIYTTALGGVTFKVSHIVTFQMH